MKRLFFILASVMMTASVWAGEASYKVVSVSPAYDAKVNGMSGIRFRILANIYDCQGKEVYCEGSLYYKDSSGEWPGVPYCPNGNNDYARVDLRSESGFVPRGKSLSSYTCESEASSHVFEVFIPYNAITHPAGHVDYQLELTFREAKDNKLIKNKEKREFVYPHPFALDWPEEWPKEQKKAAPTKTVPAGYVDLGLPSGTLWSKKNAKDQMVESEYFCHIELDKMLEDCCVPTKEQFEELMNYCTWVWNGKGYTVTGQNGQSIYLLAAGHSDFQRWWNGDKTVDDLGVKGYYWSSTRSDANSDENYFALAFGDKTHIFIMPIKKNLFISVRLVRNSK